MKKIASGVTYNIKNLWEKKKLVSTKKTFKAEIPAHEVIMLRLSPKR